METTQFDPLKTAPGQDMAKLSLKELAMLFLHKDTPAGLCKAIANDLRFMGLLGSVVELPCIEIGYHEPDDISAEMEQKMQELCAQVGELLEWFKQLPLTSLPPVIEPLPRNLQGAVASRLKNELFCNLSNAQLLALASLNIFPAWLRLAAENRFAETAKSATSGSIRRRRTRGRTAGKARPPDFLL
jgi:hypothetical protein